MKKIKEPHILAILILAVFSMACSIDLGKIMGSNSSSTPNTNVPTPAPIVTDNSSNVIINTNTSPVTQANKEQKPTVANKPIGTNNPTAAIEKIFFKKGTSSIELTHSIAPGVTKTYVYGISGNEKEIKYKFTESTGKLKVDEGTTALGEMISFPPDEPGEYELKISNPSNQTLTSKVYLSIK